MTKLNPGSTSTAVIDTDEKSGPSPKPIPSHQNIRVSQAVLDAAMKEGDALLQSLRTAIGGLTQVEAEERARTTGQNEVAQERQQGWPVRLLKIVRNPLV